MYTARIVVLIIALVAGGLAAYLVRGSDSAPAPAAPVAIPTVDVLVAKVDIGLGQSVSPENLQWQTWPADMHTPMSEAIRTLGPIFLESREEILARFPALQERTVTTQESSVAVPLLFEGGAIGAMSMGFQQRRSFSEEDADLLMALGRQCAQARLSSASAVPPFTRASTSAWAGTIPYTP